jgi:uncharacterized protein GlcG (DUF336 family)
MRLARVLGLTAAIAAFSPHVLSQTPSTQKVVTVELAQTIVQEAMATCRASGYHVTVLVVDALDMPKAMLRDDGAPASTTEIAKMKAYTAMLYNRPSGRPAPPATPPPTGGTATGPTVIPGTATSQGGVPIKVGDVTIGAVAVSGSPGGEKDAACANAGLAKVADKLK